MLLPATAAHDHEGGGGLKEEHVVQQLCVVDGPLDSGSRISRSFGSMETALAVVGGAMLYKWFFGKSQKMLTNPSDVFQLCHAGSISWDRRSFSVRGKQTLLLSGEFQYWRVPDRERWRGLLQDYKGMGLNCIRVYFHWGYHSPAPNVYHFDGNRDVEFLLSLCAELHLHVIAAPGPYICAETSGGGFPMWLLQRPDIRIRHMNGKTRPSSSRASLSPV